MLKAEGKSWTLSPVDLGSVLDVIKQDGKIDVSLNRDLLDGRLTNVYNDLTVKPVEASYDFDAERRNYSSSPATKGGASKARS